MTDVSTAVNAATPSNSVLGVPAWVLGVVRVGLGFAAGGLVTAGKIQPGDVQTIVGAGVGVATAAWAAYAWVKAHQTLFNAFWTKPPQTVASVPTTAATVKGTQQ